MFACITHLASSISLGRPDLRLLSTRAGPTTKSEGVPRPSRSLKRFHAGMGTLLSILARRLVVCVMNRPWYHQDERI